MDCKGVMQKEPAAFAVRHNSTICQIGTIGAILAWRERISCHRGMSRSFLGTPLTWVFPLLGHSDISDKRIAGKNANVDFEAFPHLPGPLDAVEGNSEIDSGAGPGCKPR